MRGPRAVPTAGPGGLPVVPAARDARWDTVHKENGLLGRDSNGYSNSLRRENLTRATLAGWAAHARPSVMGPTMVQTTGRPLCPPPPAPALRKRLLWIQAKLSKASRLGQGRLLLPEGRQGREPAVLGWRRGWVGDLGTVPAPAAAEPDQSQPCPCAPGPPVATADAQAFQVFCAGKASSRAGPFLLLEAAACLS